MLIQDRFKSTSSILGVFIIIISLMVIYGWVTHNSMFISISPHWVSMKFNTALCFLLSGINLILINRKETNILSQGIVNIFALIIFFTGTISLLEYALDYSTGIDELFINDRVQFKNYAPGMMSPLTAAMFIFTGISNYSAGKEWFRPDLFHYLNMLGISIAFIATMGYLFNDRQLNNHPLFSLMALHTAVTFILLYTANMFTRPNEGIVKAISQDNTGGKVFRSTYPRLILFFIILGSFIFVGKSYDLFSIETGIVILITSIFILFTLQLYKNVAKINKSEAELINTNSLLENAEALSRIGNWEFDIINKKNKWSKQVFLQLHLPAAAIPPNAETVKERIHPDDRAYLKEAYALAITGTIPESKIFRTNPALLPLKYIYPIWQIEINKEGQPVKLFGTTQDITNSFYKDKKIENTDNLFAKVFHSRVFGLVIVDMNRRIIDINDPICEIIGLKREALIGKTADEIGLSNNAAYVQKRESILLDLARNGKIDNYELEIITKDDKTLTLLLSIEPLTLNDTLHWLISFSDISEKKNAQKTIEALNKKTNEALRIGKIGFWDWDIKNDKSYWSDRMYEIYQVDKHTTIKYDTLLERIHPDDQAFHNKLVEERINSKDNSPFEYRLLLPDGTVKYVEVQMEVIANKKGDAEKFQGTVIDISYQKKAAFALKESELKYHSLIEQASDGITITNQQGKILEVNESMVKMLGYSKSEFAKMNLLDIIPAEDIVSKPPNYEALLKGETLNYERTIKRKDGSTFPAEINSKMAYNGSFIGFIRDISKRKAEQYKLQQSLLRNTALLNAIPDLIFVINKEGLFTDFKSTGETETYLPPEQFIGKNIREVFLEEMATATMTNIKNTLDKKIVPSHQYSLTYPDGLRHFEAKYAMINEDEVITVVRDITAEKQAEQKIVESEDILRTTLNRISNGFVSLDKNWCYTFMNTKASEIFNRDPDKIIGKNIWKEFPEGIGKPFHKAYEKAMATQEYIYLEEYYEPYDSWFENHIYPSPEGLSIYFGDITDRKKAEIAMRESEEKFRQLAENIEEVFFIRRPDNSEMEYISPAYEKVWGQSRESLYANPSSFINNVLDEDTPSLMASLDLQKKGEVSVINYRIKNNKGQIRHIHSRAYPVYNERGEFVRVAGLAEDITERIDANEAINKLNEELEQRVNKRTADLQKANKDLQEVNDLFVGREARIIELKAELKTLKNDTGKN